MKRGISVYLIDDVEHVRNLIETMLDLDGFDIAGSSGDPIHGIAQVLILKPDVVVLDYMMPDLDGVQAARQIKEEHPDQKIILYTAYVTEDLKRVAKKEGISLCIGKIDGLQSLERAIASLCLDIHRN